MELVEVVRRRRMVRRFDPSRPVPDAALDRVVRTATRAPNAGFSQGWDFLLLSDAADRDLFWRVSWESDQEMDGWVSGVRHAPALVLCLSDRDTYLRRYAEPDKGWTDRDEARWPVAYWDVDTGMAALLMLLTAVDEGLGGLFFGVAPEYHDDVHDAFEIPRDRTIVGVVAVGYPDPQAQQVPPRRPRRAQAEVIHRGRFGTAY